MSNKPVTYKLLAGLLVAMSAASAGRAVAAGSGAHTASLISPAGEWETYQLADINGDGRRDVLIGIWTEQQQRELLVYEQSAQGSFDNTPSRRIALKDDIIAYAIADLRPEPGDELIFFSRAGAFSFSPRQSDYRGNLKPLVRHTLLASMAEKDALVFLGKMQDITGNGAVDLLLPGPDHYWLYPGAGKEQFAEPQALPAPFRHPALAAVDAEFTFTSQTGLDFRVDWPSPYADQLAALIPADTTPVLDWQAWLPGVHVYRRAKPDAASTVNALAFIDDWQTLNREAKRLTLWQPEQGNKSAAVSHHSVPRHNRVQLADINNDGLTDLFSLDHSAADNAKLHLFAQKPGGELPKSPQQIMRFNGYDVEVLLHDLTGDARPELVVSYYSLSAAEAVRGGNMLRTTLVYLPAQSDAEVLFEKRPHFKLDEKFSASAFRGLVQRWTFSTLPGEHGAVEAFSVNNQAVFEARPIEDGAIAEQAAWRYVPRHAIINFSAETLNDDSVTDVVLEHQHTLTLLVSP